MRARKRLIFLLSLLFVFSTATTVLSRSASADLPIISLGANVIENGDTIWFGQYNSMPILWRVLANGSDTRLPVSGAGEALLISSNVLDNVEFINLDDNEENDDSYARAWTGSDAQNWCTNFLGNWKDGSAEKAAIKQTSVTEIDDKTIEPAYTSEEDMEYEDMYSTCSYNYYGGRLGDYYCAASLNNESFFFLSAQEAETYFVNNDDRDTTTSWWLRSPAANYGVGIGSVLAGGDLEGNYEGDSDGARPAFNLDLARVLFSSKASVESNAYKLTLVDSNRTIGIQPGKTLARNNATSITVPYAMDSDVLRF